VCSNRAKEINELLTSTQKRLSPMEEEQLFFSEFTQQVLEIYQFLEVQVNKGIIFMNSKKYDGITRVNEMISSRLQKAGSSVREFVEMVSSYNALGETYIKKSEYFSDI
jgi:hypothetical protein